MVSRKYKINLVPGSYSDVIRLSQYDEDYPVIFELHDGTQTALLPKGITAVMRGTRRDGLGFFYPCTVSGATVKVVIDTAMTALDGNAEAEVACVIGGHCHRDGMVKTDGGVPVIATTCDRFYGYEERVAGTIAEHAFDVVTIDTSAKTINMTRIGYGSDRTFTYGTV